MHIILLKYDWSLITLALVNLSTYIIIYVHTYEHFSLYVIQVSPWHHVREPLSNAPRRSVTDERDVLRIDLCHDNIQIFFYYFFFIHNKTGMYLMRECFVYVYLNLQNSIEEKQLRQLSFDSHFFIAFIKL